MGHSHFENGVNPYLLGDDVFDFAIEGRWIYYDVELARRLLPTMSNLKTVIFPLGYKMPYTSWHFTGLREIDKDYAYKYAQYMGVYYDRFPDCLLLRSALLRNKLGPKYWKSEPQDTLGFYPGEGQMEDWDISQNIDPNCIYGDTARLCYEEYREYLKELAKICYENDIRFVVVTTPCANCYVSNTCEQGIKNLYDLVDSVAVHYPIEYFNYLNDDEFRSDSIYYNSSHLNSVGADQFTRRLMKDLGL